MKKKIRERVRHFLPFVCLLLVPNYCLGPLLGRVLILISQDVMTGDEVMRLPKCRDSRRVTWYHIVL